MKIIGSDVSGDVLRRVQEEIFQIFSGMPAHWKRDFFDDSVVVVVQHSDLENAMSVSIQEGSFVVYVDEKSEESLEEIVNSFVIMYLGAFINLDEVVEPIVNDVMSAYGIAHEDRLFALVLWFRGEGHPGLTNRSDDACEEIDRRLAGVYVPRLSIEHGLSVQ